MRIIAGTHRSRAIQTLAGNQTRPTADKAKGAVFSKLGTYFDGGMMLDLFAGSGNMGLEAISRGMTKVIFNDSSRDACAIISKNISNFKMEKHAVVWNFDYLKCLEKCIKANYCFDLIFVDPPYALGKMPEIFQLISDGNLLSDNGTLVVESDKKDQFEDTYGDLIKEKEATYGICRMSYYRKKERT